VDESRGAVETIQANLALVPGASAAAVLQKDARAALRALVERGERFDVVFLDPPYASDLYEAVLPLAEAVLAEGGVIVAEHFHKRGLPERIGGLVNARSVRVGDHRLTFFKRPEESE
jgi:16S rRNA (guanine966-N2)-methyltransferase